MALDEFSLPHLALSVNAFETGRNWERREEVACKARLKEAWNIVCVIKPAENPGVFSRTVSIWHG